MGEHKVRHVQHFEDRARFLPRLIEDVATLEAMLQESSFEKHIQRIGAEQEICVVDAKTYKPLPLAVEILESMPNCPWLDNELARFNLEINLQPQEW